CPARPAEGGGGHVADPPLIKKTTSAAPLRHYSFSSETYIMAGRRVAVKAIDWLAFAERVPPNQKSMFNALKTRSDAIAAKLSSLPETAAAIDWSLYRTTVAKAGMVDDFEKKDKDALAYIEASKARVAEYEKELGKFKDMIPVEQMTIDDLNNYFPETKLDKEKYPYWPHQPIASL
ncbi:hypothetical protein F7725_016202, partial [Dissostichus mawsoni]